MKVIAFTLTLVAALNMRAAFKEQRDKKAANNKDEPESRGQVWRRCSVKNGVVYRKRAKDDIRPAPVRVACAPGYDLRNATGALYEKNDLICKSKKIEPVVRCVQEVLPTDAPTPPSWKPGCPAPTIEDMQFNVIDKFMNHRRYGYVLEISTPSNMTKYSIALEYPSGTTGAHLQAWNLNFFGFYNRFVVFHSKAETVDGDDPTTHVIVMNNMNQEDPPKFHLFRGLIAAHGCFQGGKIGRGNDYAYATGRWESDITSVKIDRVSHGVWPKG